MIPQDCFFTSDDGLKLYYQTYGDKKSAKRKILCLPGLTRNSKDFRNFAFRRANEFDDYLICPDMRGRGRSDYDTEPLNYAVPREVADIIKILDTEELSEMLIVATSRGGFQAGLLSGTRPDLVKGVVLNDIGVKAPLEALEKISAIFRLSAERFKEISELKSFLRRFDAYKNENYSPEEERDFINANYYKKDGVLSRNFDAEGLQIAYEASMSALRLAPEAVTSGRVDFSALFFGLIERPVLLLRGENSDLCTAEIAEVTLKILCQSELAVIPGRGHAPLLTEAESIAAIDNFLARFG